jgi:hypothetical protein
MADAVLARRAAAANAVNPPVDPVDNQAAIPADLRERIKIPLPAKFKGSREPEAIRKWLLDMNNYSRFYNLTDPQKIALVPYYLDETAAQWWEGIQEADEIPLAWAGVEDLFRAEFLPKNYISRLRTQLANLRQSTTVAAYSAAFRKTLLSLPRMEPEIVLHLYIQGLKPATRLEVEMKEPETLNDAEVQALRVDDIRFGRNPQPQRPSYPTRQETPRVAAVSTPPNRLGKLTDQERQRLRSSGACFRCRQQGHVARECPSNSAAPSGGTGARPNHQPARRPYAVAAVDAATSTNASGNASRQ